MVTAELALAIPAVLMVLAAVAAAVVTLGAKLACVDAAREGARAAARGESDAVIRSVVARTGPDGATVSVGRSGDSVTVTVRTRISPLGGAAGSWSIDAAATARMEPDDPTAGLAGDPP